MAVKRLHRYCALLLAAFWLVQAITGIATAFRWEIDDRMLVGERFPVEAEALGRRIEALGRNAKVESLWASSGVDRDQDVAQVREIREAIAHEIRNCIAIDID